MRLLGHEAITMLVRLIAGHDLEETHVTMETTLVRRRTTAAPGAAS
jgi:LacI family transcriptional regulator